MLFPSLRRFRVVPLFPSSVLLCDLMSKLWCWHPSLLGLRLRSYLNYIFTRRFSLLSEWKEHRLWGQVLLAWIHSDPPFDTDQATPALWTPYMSIMGYLNGMICNTRQMMTSFHPTLPCTHCPDPAALICLKVEWNGRWAEEGGMSN